MNTTQARSVSLDAIALINFALTEDRASGEAMLESYRHSGEAYDLLLALLAQAVSLTRIASQVTGNDPSAFLGAVAGAIREIPAP